MIFTPFLHVSLVHKLSRFLMAALLFATLGAGMNDVFERGHSGDFQKVAVLVCDEPSDSGDLEFFVPPASLAPCFTPPPNARHEMPVVRPVQAIYSPPTRPPAVA